jgi:hypothetical protein
MKGDRYDFQALVGPAAPGSLLSILMTLDVARLPEQMPLMKF